MKKYKPIWDSPYFWGNLRAVFFPRDFYEKYKYLGSVPYQEGTKLWNVLLPLVLVMDYHAKPKWCPRWVLRFLHLFGNDNSIVRVRNYPLHNLHRKLTKGIFFVDYKTKWHDYDLRISIYAPQQIQDLADDIEHRFYARGRREELLEQLGQIPEAEGKYRKWDPLHELQALYEQLTEIPE
jgi:hypothetical protein